MIKKKNYLFLAMLATMLMMSQTSKSQAYEFPDSIKHRNSSLHLMKFDQLQGAIWQVADKAARDAIPADKRWVNMLIVYNDSVFRFDGSDVLTATWQNAANWTLIAADPYNDFYETTDTVDLAKYADTSGHALNADTAGYADTSGFANNFDEDSIIFVQGIGWKDKGDSIPTDTTISSDYITNGSGVSGTYVSDALDWLDGNKADTSEVVARTGGTFTGDVTGTNFYFDTLFVYDSDWSTYGYMVSVDGFYYFYDAETNALAQIGAGIINCSSVRLSSQEIGSDTYTFSFNTDSVLTIKRNVNEKVMLGFDDSLKIIASETEISGNLEVNGTYTDINSDSVDFRGAIAQYHRNDTINTATASTWTDVKWDTLVASETTYGYAFNADSTGHITSFAGVTRVQGCGHWLWNGSPATSVKLYIRVTVNGVEARCLQANDTRTNATGDDGTLPYTGTIHHDIGDEIKVQYYVTNIGMDFEGDAVFDNPVSFSVNYEKISDD